MKDLGRLVIKIAGESGQGVNSIGEMVAKALKRSGFYTFGYREYPSLIKGGYASHQIDISSSAINSSSEKTDLMVNLSRASFHAYLPTLREGAHVIHMIPQLDLTDEDQKFIKKEKINIYYLPAEELAKEVGGKAIMANSVMVGALWRLLALPLSEIKTLIQALFKHKPEAIKPNLGCLEKGYGTILDENFKIKITPSPKAKNMALLTGNHLLALGGVAAGVRAYFAYPMTPSSSILSYMAQIYHETGILVKQLDDEISVAQFALGANFMGTRALVATSGGGYDLMTESVSLSAMTETPFVCILAQRPGPATGMPTWTSAGDLNLAVYSGHGEFPRCVIALSDGKSAYDVVQKAFDIAEKYQIPVIILTEKQIAESLFQISDLENIQDIKRYLAANPSDLKSSDRYKITPSGISPRWLPGQSEATFVANSDEHLEDGSLTEESMISSEMNQKRLRKLGTLKEELPEPDLIGPEDASLTFVGWGSTKNTVNDAIAVWNRDHKEQKVNFLHFEFVYPIKVEKIKKLIDKKQPLVLIENNSFGQLGNLLAGETGFIFREKLLKSDGRPFFIEDIYRYLEGRLNH